MKCVPCTMLPRCVTSMWPDQRVGTLLHAKVDIHVPQLLPYPHPWNPWLVVELKRTKRRLNKSGDIFKCLHEFEMRIRSWNTKYRIRNFKCGKYGIEWICIRCLFGSINTHLSFVKEELQHTHTPAHTSSQPLNAYIHNSEGCFVFSCYFYFVLWHLVSFIGIV